MRSRTQAGRVLRFGRGVGGAGWLDCDGFLKQRLRLRGGQRKGGGSPGGAAESSLVGRGSLEGSSVFTGSSRLEFWGPSGSPGNRLLPGPGDPGILVGEGGSPAGTLPNPAAGSPGILLLRDGKSRLGLQLIPPLQEEEGPRDSFLYPLPSRAGPSSAVGGVGGPGQASKAWSHVLEPSPACSGHQDTLEAKWTWCNRGGVGMGY